MKSQRRHELQENQLAKGIIKIPSFFERYGNKIFIAIIVICLVYIIVTWRIRSKAQSQQLASDALTTAITHIDELHGLGLFTAGPAQTAAMRSRLITDAHESLAIVTGETDDRRLLAEAAIAKGDLNWHIANLPQIAGAATQSSLRPDIAPDKALDAAESSYKRVLEEYPDQKLATIAARLGLAAIAENRDHWDQARQQYQTLVNDAAVPKTFQSHARFKLELINRIERPAYLAKPTSRPAIVEQSPAATAPSAAAASQPAR